MKNILTAMLLIMMLVISCQFQQQHLPGQTIVRKKYVTAEKVICTWQFNTPARFVVPPQYILVLEDSIGNVYHYQANEIHFQKIQVGDSLYYNPNTGTMIFIK